MSKKVLHWDFCLVQTTKPMTLDGVTAKAIKLAPPTQNILNEKCMVAGWGATENQLPSTYLKAVDVTSRDASKEKFNKFCRNALKYGSFCSYGDNISGVKKGNLKYD